MGLDSFVESPITTVVNTRNRLNQTKSLVIKSFVEWVLLFAVIIVAENGYTVHFFLLKVAELSLVINLATVRVRTRGAFRHIGCDACTAKTETAV